MSGRTSIYRFTTPMIFALVFLPKVACAGPFTDIQQRVNVSVDPRVELFSVVLLLSGFDGPSPNAWAQTRFEFPYKQEILGRFGSYREHRAVKLYLELASRGFWLTHPPAVMVHLSEPPELAIQYPVDELRVKMAGGPDSLELFISAMREFARDADFMSFFDEHVKMYDLLAADYRSRIDLDFVTSLEDFFGAKQNSYNIILTALFMPGGYGPRVEVEPGTFDAYYIGGPLEVRDDSLPGFRPDIWLILHEFGHSFVNCLTDSHLERLIGPWTALDTESKPLVEGLGFPWALHVSDQVSENVNRATESRIRLKLEGRKEADKEMMRSRNRGFPFVVMIFECLDEYEQNRDKYPTFEDFYPRLVEAFEKAAREKETGR